MWYNRYMKKHKGYKFRIYPNKEQAQKLLLTMHAVRAMYNILLADKQEYYAQTKEMLYNRPAMYKDDHPWLKEVDSSALCNVQLSLEKAYRSFFKGNNDFPKFKSRKKSRMSYTTNNISSSIRIEDGKLRLPKIGFVKIVLHREYKGVIKSVTVSQSRSGKFYASLLCEYDFEQPKSKLDENKAIGLDYSSTFFYVDSNNDTPESYEKIFMKYSDKLAREQRKLAHMKLGSRNFEKQKVVVNRIHEKIANTRNDFLHKQSRFLINNCDYIFVEDLDLQEIAKPNPEEYLKLGLATADNSFGKFREYLAYKAEERGKIFHKTNKWYPSTKTCSHCGNVQNIDINERIYRCPKCGTVINRDYNAAINILHKGFEELNL